MATDKLIFPIGFDLEKAVADAEGQADKLLRRLETTIRSRPLAVNLKITNAGSGSINEINARMKEIVKEWNNLTEAERIGSRASGEYTDRAKKLIAEFTRLTGATESYARGLQQITAAARKAANEQERNLEKQRKTEAILKAQENTIANITAKLQHYKKELNSAEMGSKQFRKAAEEVKRLSQTLTEAQRRVNALTDNFKKQDGYVSRLVKRLAVYAGYQQFTNFITSVREVTAEFELQRISLGAIIQDQAKANQLFSEIKQFALKSPVKILDLTKYTKQLAAYKFETKELFDWTKRLTDISVGLGVSMDRIILLAGQIRATGYLRGSEVRQATEAGIPLVEELAKKLEELNGRAYTTAEVMNLISERAISWEMVADVFKDMTSAGGMFFDIQEKQGNTLYGMWQKLGDAASVMYEEIGNTKSINDGMKNLISTLRTLMLNWKQTGAAIATLGVATLVYVNRVKLANIWTKLSSIANQQNVISLKARLSSLIQLTSTQRAATLAVKADTIAARVWTSVQIRAYQAANLVKAALKGLKTVLATNIWGIAILGLSLLVEKLWLAEDATEKLKNKLSDIKLDYEVKQGQDASNFEYLANAAVEAAKGSKAQKDALEELKNTYGKIIPLELLTIENLERMKGNYGELIALIDEYNLKQKYEAETSAIEDAFAPKQEKRAGIIREKLRKGLRLDYADEETYGALDKVLDLSERNIQRFLLNLNKYANEGLDKKEQIIQASADMAKELGLNEGESEALTKAMVELDRHEFEGQGTLMDYTEGLQRKHEALSVVNEDYDKAKQKLNEYSSIVDDVMKKNEDEPEVATYDNVIENEKARLNKQIGDVANGIIELFNKANAEVDNGTQQLLQTVVTNGGMIPATVWDLLEKTAENINDAKLLAAIQSLRQHYQKLAPDNETVNFIRSGFIKIVNAAKGNMQEYRQYLYDGSVTIKEYQDNLNKGITSLKAQAYEMIRVNALIDAGLVEGQKYDEATIKAAQDKADVLQSILDQLVTPLIMPDDKKPKPGDTKSDDRLSKLQEILSTLEKINTKYEELRKKEGSTKALEDIQRMYANTLEYANKLGKQFGLKFEMPTDFKDLQKSRESVLAVIRKLRMKGYEKAALDLEEKIGTGDIDRLQKDIEKKLKELADRISRTKTAKEFYEKILAQTGDVELAASLSFVVHGEAGADLNKQIREQIEQLVKGTSATLDASVFRADGTFDPKKLREFAQAQVDALGGVESKAYQGLIKLSDDAEKDFAKTIEGWLKATEKAKKYSDKLLDLARTTSNEISKINQNKGHAQARIDELLGLDSLTTDEQAELSNLQKFIAEADAIIQRFRDKQSKEELKLGYEAFKDSPMYVQMFDDLDNASTRMLENMKSRITAMQSEWKDLEPTQLKELQSRLNEIDKQLVTRNPFKTLADSISRYREMLKSGSAKQADIALMAASARTKKAAEAFNTLLKKYGDGTEEGTKKLIASNKEVADAQAELNAAMANEEAAQKAVENWKEVKDIIKLSANELFDMLNWAGDVASAIADISEAMGADEEDVQYWEDVASALGDVAGGIQDIVSAAMSANVVGVISSALTAIPKMFVGFSNLFYAGKIKQANKEIRKQEEVLARLEYQYGRLEAAAEKAFGVQYVRNYTQQLQLLQAEAEAYRKQAEAEESKGKKADADKVKEYKDAARDVYDEIADMRGALVEQMAGTDVASAARDFAQAWLEAYASFGSTTDAIKEKFNDMIKNMIVESVMARTVQMALQPMFDEMDRMYVSGASMTDVLTYAMGKASTLSNDISDALAVNAKVLEGLGVNVRGLYESGDSLSGISRDIASASEESINGLATGINTQNFYISQQLAEVQAIRAMLESALEPDRAVQAAPGGAVLTMETLQREAFDRFAAIERHTSETVAECRRIAEQCTAMATDIHRVVVPSKGSTASYGLQVYMR